MIGKDAQQGDKDKCGEAEAQMQAPWVLPQKPLRQRSDECGGGKRMEAGFKEGAAQKDEGEGRVGKQHGP